MNKVTKKRRTIKNRYKSIKKRDVRKNRDSKRRRSHVISNNKTKRVYTGGALFSRKKKEETRSDVGTSSGWDCRCRFAEKSQEDPASTTEPVVIYDIAVEDYTPNPKAAAAATAATAATSMKLPPPPVTPPVTSQQNQRFTQKGQKQLLFESAKQLQNFSQRRSSMITQPPLSSPPPPPPPPLPPNSYVRKQSVMTELNQQLSTGLNQNNLKNEGNKIVIKNYNKTTNQNAIDLSELNYDIGSGQFKDGDVILQINGDDVEIYENEKLTEKFKSAIKNKIQNGKITFTVQNSKGGSESGNKRTVTIIPENVRFGQAGGATPEETTKNVICECKKRPVAQTSDV